MRVRKPWPFLVALLAASGCSGSAKPSHRSALTLPQSPPLSGRTLFARDCGACHSLIGNESLHRQGGDLLGYHLTRAQLTSFTQVMPTRPLSRTELAAVVEYVLRAERSGRAR